MSGPSLSERVEQQSHMLSQLALNMSSIENQINLCLRDLATVAQPVKTQIKMGLEMGLMKNDLKTMKNQLADIQVRLNVLDETLLKKDIEAKTRSVFFGYAKQGLPLLWGLCAAMLVLGLTLDDLRLVKLILGQNA